MLTLSYEDLAELLTEAFKEGRDSKTPWWESPTFEFLQTTEKRLGT